MRIEIAFKGMESSEAVDQRVRKEIEKLQPDGIQRCHVTVESPHRHSNKGNDYSVRVHISVPGDEIIVNHERHDGTHEDVYVAIRDAFLAANRQLCAYHDKRKGQVKSHSMPKPE
jgi:ribosome-associated translation inhibitor RaiA